jgi:hypothetical protein
MNDHDEADHGAYPLAPPDPAESMEQRIRRLEKAISAMQDTRLMEERVVEKVVNRIDQAPQQAPAHPGEAADGTTNGGPELLSGSVRAVGSQLVAMTSPAAESNGSVFSAKSWILTDIAQEIRTFFVMFFDFRYRTSPIAKIIPIGAFFMFVLSWIFMQGSVIFIGSLMNYMLDLFLVILVYKTLQREAARYRAILPSLPPRVVVR